MEHIDNADQADSTTQSVAVLQSEPQYQEQPGGRVLMLNGEPVAGKSVHEETMNAYAWLAGYHAFLGPLTEAAITNGVQRPGMVRARIVSEWGNDVAGVYADEARHVAYVEHCKKQIYAAHPWLWPLFESAGAMVQMSPGDGVAFCLSTRPGIVWDVPGLKPFVAMTPFADAGEVAH